MKKLVLYLLTLTAVLCPGLALAQEGGELKRGEMTKQALGVAAQRLYDQDAFRRVLALSSVRGDTTEARASQDWQNYLSTRLSAENRNQAAEYFTSQLIAALQTSQRFDSAIAGLRQEMTQLKSSASISATAAAGAANTADGLLTQKLSGEMVELRQMLDAARQEITDLRRMLADVSRNAAVATSHTARYGDRIKAIDALADVRNILPKK